MKYIVNTPEGTRDRLFGECRERRKVQSALTHLFRQRGFAEVITPDVEYYDLFTLTGNSIPQEDMLKIVDRSGKLVVMRPDSTTPIARVAATKLKSTVLPQRLYYNQTCYRSGAAHLGQSQEIAQCGVEMIGAAGKKAELETIALAVDSLLACGLEHFHIEIGHAGFFKAVIREMDLPEDTAERVRDCIAGKNFAALNALLAGYSDQPGTEVLKRISRLFGGIEVLDEAEGLTGSYETISYLRELYQQLDCAGYGKYIRFDLGMVNQMEYYTGIVFRGYVEGVGNAVVSGGRYDNLVECFGRKAQAIGFAVYVDDVARCLPEVELPCPQVVVHYDVDQLKAALYEVDHYPAGVCQLSPCNSLESTLNLAKEKGIGTVMILSGGEKKILEVASE